MNEFVAAEEAPTDLLRVDPAIGERQRAKLTALRANRDSACVESLLNKLQSTAEGTGNLVPVMVECVENKVTLGEISHRLRRVWGEQRETVVI